ALRKKEKGASLRHRRRVDRHEAGFESMIARITTPMQRDSITATKDTMLGGEQRFAARRTRTES
ncbi:MAG TPA: hypothetical protein VNR40_18000, partial [Steroidobacter sp.]|nr:hypothetical protein [Steroidobacter sp.]